MGSSPAASPTAPPEPTTRTWSDVAPILALFATFTMALQPLADPDSFWHLGAGRHMYATRTIPKLDPFSWSAVDHQWIAHEWLIECIMWPIWRLGGPGTGDALLTAIFAVLITGAFAVVWKTAERLGASRMSAAGITVLAALASRHTFNPRPQMVSLLLTAWLAQMLVAPPPGKPRLRYWFPVLCGVWANLHGGFFLGLVLIVTASGIETIQWLGRLVVAMRDPDPKLPSFKPLIRALTIGAGSVCAATANPNETAGLLYPLRYLREYKPMMKFNAEWQSPGLSAAYLPFLLLVLLAFVTARLSRVKPTLLQVAFVALGVFLGFSAVRNIPVTAVLVGPLAATWITAARSRLAEHTRTAGAADVSLVESLTTADPARSTPTGDDKTERPRTLSPSASPWSLRPLPTRGLGVALSLTLLGGGALTASGTAQARRVDAHAALFPSRTLDELQRLKTANVGRVFNAHDFGGWLIWNGVQVGMDGRTDMYGVPLFLDYLKTWTGSQGWQERLDRDRVEYVLVEPNAGLAKRLSKDARWKLAATDQVSVLFARADA